ncbi:amino acid racemase [Halalkalibacter lacteus]|uniref:amino acid racemase n=1 Tax=Halalkalibacter lacteus TaxID=3090663 RepID=UPI002FCA777A
MIKMKHVGLVGVSAVGAALCYQELVIKCLKRYGNHPEITLHNMPVNMYSNQDLRKTGDILLSSLTSLRDAGAEITALTANTTHYALDSIRKEITLPILDIVDLTVNKCKNLNYKMVTVLGTFVTMNFGLYEKKFNKLGIELVQPTLEEQEEIDRIISEELQAAIVKKESKEYINKIAIRLSENHSEAIILACTELPLLNFESHSINFINPNELLVEEIIQYSVINTDNGKTKDHVKLKENRRKFEVMSSYFNYPQQDLVKENIQKGVDCLNQDNYDEAYNYFYEATNIDSSDPEAISWFAIVLGYKMEASNALVKVKLLPKFEQSVQKCLDLAPDSLIVRRISGTRLIKIPQEFGGDLEKGLRELLYCIENGLQDEEIYKLISYAYLQLGDNEKSEEALRHVREIAGVSTS